MAKIAFYKGYGGTWKKKLINEAIKIWTRGKYSHVELINDWPETIVLSHKEDWQWFSADAYTNRVRCKIMSMYNPMSWDIYDLITFNEKAAFDSIINKIGNKYDWIGIILSQIFNSRRHCPDKWFCSELVRKALADGNLIVDDNKHHLYSPNDLYNELRDNMFIKQ